jgi:hypothetical protein
LPAEEIAAWKDDTQEKAFAAWMADAAKFSGLSESDLTRFREQYVAIVAEELKKAGYQEVVSNGCDAK